tara:strand:- start:59 stop:229 length:171 start_codon:yes stop_codon:yes gene_type:complete
MDENTYNNWVRIKEMLEKTGKTGSHFYKRACQIVSNRTDPGLMPPTFDAGGASNLP